MPFSYYLLVVPIENVVNEASSEVLQKALKTKVDSIKAAAYSYLINHTEKSPPGKSEQLLHKGLRAQFRMFKFARY